MSARSTVLVRAVWSWYGARGGVLATFFAAAAECMAAGAVLTQSALVLSLEDAGDVIVVAREQTVGAVLHG